MLLLLLLSQSFAINGKCDVSIIRVALANENVPWERKETGASSTIYSPSRMPGSLSKKGNVILIRLSYLQREKCNGKIVFSVLRKLLKRS